MLRNNKLYVLFFSNIFDQNFGALHKLKISQI